MILTTADNFFELSIKGYEFPDFLDEFYDANWLMIAGRVRLRSTGDWSFCCPCMLTTDVKNLIEFLEAGARNELTYTGCGFFEPNLSFSLIYRGNHTSEAGKKGNSTTSMSTEPSYDTLRVYFDAESLPPGCKHEIYCDFSVTPATLRSTAQNLREQLIRFPVREAPI